MPTTPTTPDPEDNQPHERNPMPNTGDNVRASWNFSLHDVRSNMAHCTAAHKQLMIDAFLWSIDPKHPVTLHEFANEVGYDRTTVWKVYTGKYVKIGSGERLDVPAKMAKGAREFLARQRLAFRGRDEFVLTPTAKRIWTGCDLARESHTPVFILGPSHIGKTWALENYAAENNHGATPYIRMKAACGLGGMVKRIASKVGVSDKGNTLQLIDYLKNAITPEMVLILDELHLLVYTYRLASFFACLEVIREIYDETGCGMALCGTQLLMEKIRGGQHTEMEQLVRRGVHKIILPGMPTKGDLEVIFARYGLEFPGKKESITHCGVIEKPYDLVRQLAKREGLKAISERLRYAEKLARRQNDEHTTWAHVVAAHTIIESNQTPDPDWD